MENDPLLQKGSVSSLPVVGGVPPVGFGYTGEFEKLPVKAQTGLKTAWAALSPAEKDKVVARSAHLRYDHEAFLAHSV